MSSDAAQLHVSGNTPRLLKEGEPLPRPASGDVPVEELEAPHVYWTPEKAQHVVAQICRAGSKFYGPSVKAAEWELELIGDPAAAVLNDWLPLRVGASSDKTANLIVLGAVLAILVLLRLPDILEVHGIIKPWQPRQPKQAQQPELREEPAAATGVSEARAPFEAQLVGQNGSGGDDDKRRRELFGAQTVGGSGGFAGAHE